MTKAEKLRRVVRVCGYFVRNLAYYRAAWRNDSAGKKELRGNLQHFWLQANSNFLDIAVLEWCKLFGDKRGEHHWSKVVADAASFESGLLGHLGLKPDDFERYIETMRRYRDKFVAHLDVENQMNIAQFDIAKSAVEFYHKYILDHEISSSDELAGLVTDLHRCYQDAIEEAKRIYEASGIRE